MLEFGYLVVHPVSATTAFGRRHANELGGLGEDVGPDLQLFEYEHEGYGYQCTQSHCRRLGLQANSYLEMSEVS